MVLGCVIVVVVVQNDSAEAKTVRINPVIYYLHGFMGTDEISPTMKTILDKGISSGKIRPFILVMFLVAFML